jgi:hypothetical protein
VILLIISFIVIAYIGYRFEHCRRNCSIDPERQGHWIWGFVNVAWNHFLLFPVVPVIYLIELILWMINLALYNMRIVYCTTVDWINIVSMAIASKYYGKQFRAVEVGDDLIAVSQEKDNKDEA